MQTDIFSTVAADPVSAELARAGLPYETRVGGELRCRHHPARAIRCHAAPCVECWRAARGEGAEGAEPEGGSDGASM